MDNQVQPQTNTPSEEQQMSKKERRELRREERRAEAESTHSVKSVRRFILWAAAILAIGGAAAGVWYLAKSNPDGSTPPDGNGLSQQVSSADWARGNPSAKVALVEYVDFQCPACAQYHPIVKQLKEEFGTQVAFVVRHFPLSQVHPNAKPAARAAEAAGLQGKFWEMHDLLFERQSEWAPKPSARGIFVSYAKELGLNTDQFEKDMNRDDIEDKIETQYGAGVASGVNATPTFFLNGAKLTNPGSLDMFRNMLTEAITAVGGQIAASSTQSTDTQ